MIRIMNSDYYEAECSDGLYVDSLEYHVDDMVSIINVFESMKEWAGRPEYIILDGVFEHEASFWDECREAEVEARVRMVQLYQNRYPGIDIILLVDMDIWMGNDLRELMEELNISWGNTFPGTLREDSHEPGYGY